MGHGLDPLYEHVAAKWRQFCQQDDEEKRKYSALWSILAKINFDTPDVAQQLQEFAKKSLFLRRYGSSGYNRVGAEAVARSAIIFG